MVYGPFLAARGGASCRGTAPLRALVTRDDSGDGSGEGYAEATSDASGGGALPLDMLEARVDAWIAASKSA